MSAEMNSVATSLTLADEQELRTAVGEMFCVFQRKYGQRWRDRFDDKRARPTWFASLRKAGVTASQVKAGMAALSVPGSRRPADVGWPPSDEEFIALCLPPAPPLAAALREAQTWVHDRTHVFSNPAIAAAAKSVGEWGLRTLDARELLRVFDAAYAVALRRLARGESLDVPIPRALPAHVGVRIPPGQPDPPRVALERAKLARLLGLSS